MLLLMVLSAVCSTVGQQVITRLFYRDGIDPITEQTFLNIGGSYGDFKNMIGGSNFTDFVFPQAVPIRQVNSGGGFIKFPCFATLKGKSPPDNKILYTAASCEPDGYIERRYSLNGVSFLEIALVPNPSELPNGSSLISKLDPFNVLTYKIGIYSHLDETAYVAGELIKDKANYSQILAIGGPAIVLASTPYKAATVSLNQTDCTKVNLGRRQLFGGRNNYSEEPPEGVFCIFEGSAPVNLPVIPGKNATTILPGMPCEDSIGSPILVDDFNHILGFVYSVNCDDSFSSTYLDDKLSPKMALGVSFAHAFDKKVVPEENYPTITEPPEYTGTLLTFRTVERHAERIEPFSTSAVIAAERLLVLWSVVVITEYSRSTQLLM